MGYAGITIMSSGGVIKPTFEFSNVLISDSNIVSVDVYMTAGCSFNDYTINIGVTDGSNNAVILSGLNFTAVSNYQALANFIDGSVSIAAYTTNLSSSLGPNRVLLGTLSFQKSSITNYNFKILNSSTFGLDGTTTESYVLDVSLVYSYPLSISTILPPTISLSNTVTNNTKPTIAGTAEANSTVTVYDGATALGTATASSTGACPG